MNITVTGDGRVSWIGADEKIVTARCALGRGGIGHKSGEGDGLTPIGRFPLRRVFYRPDVRGEPTTKLLTHRLKKNDGWCDDPRDPAYNTLVSLPHAAGHEVMWRDDEVYDVIVETGFNDDPVVPGKGSAIFIHIARPDYAPTEGCIALARPDLLELLAACDGNDTLEITDAST